jgi:hypothetical protein
MRILILGGGASLGLALRDALLDTARLYKDLAVTLAPCIECDWTFVEGVSDTGLLTTYKRTAKARCGRQYKALVGPQTQGSRSHTTEGPASTSKNRT